MFMMMMMINVYFVLMHMSTPKKSTLNTSDDVLLHNCQQFVVSFET